jgi:hypothetical protein
MVYRDFPIEQARQHFDELKLPAPKPKRKLRIPGKDNERPAADKST